MSHNSVEGPKDSLESFADLLDSYGPGSQEDFRIGDKVKGKVISIGKERIYIDTGTKIDGFVEKEAFLDDSGQLTLEVGDSVELYVAAYSGDEITLVRALTGGGGLGLLRRAFENSVPLEGKVTGQVKGGFQVEVNRKRAFCPLSQMDLRYVEDTESYLGNTYRFLITRFEENGRNIVLSRRKLLEKEGAEERKKFLETLRPGDRIQGKVTRLMPYGVFVELFPGLEGMAHISELSWSRVEKPEEVTRVGDNVEVIVLNIEKSSKGSFPRISLSLKQVSGDPWERVEESIREGDRIEGKVTRCTNFGAFIEITPGVEGLVHISEMSYLKRIQRPEEVVQVGQRVPVLVKEIDQPNRRISLSIKEVEGDPWVGIQERYTPGQTLEGILDKRESFGIFIQLEPGVVGLMPQSKLGSAPDPAILSKLKPGDPIAVMITEIQAGQRKITLAPADSKGENDWKPFAGSNAGSLGTLGEKLRQAIQSKSGKSV